MHIAVTDREHCKARPLDLTSVGAEDFWTQENGVHLLHCVEQVYALGLHRNTCFFLGQNQIRTMCPLVYRIRESG